MVKMTIIVIICGNDGSVGDSANVKREYACVSLACYTCYTCYMYISVTCTISVMCSCVRVSW